METSSQDKHIKYTSIDTILLKVETDYDFLKDIREIAEKRNAAQNKQYFDEKKQYISQAQLEQIHNKATYHAAANTINQNNIIHEEEQKNILDMSSDRQLCFCGCNKELGPSLPLSVNQQKIASLGSGVILLFFYLRHIRQLVLLCFLTFGVFSFISNYAAAKEQYIEICSQYQIDSFSWLYCQANTRASFQSVAYTSLVVWYQHILGMVMVFIWVIGIKVIRNLGDQKDKEIDNILDSSADYAVKIDNLPYGQYTQEQILEYLQFVWLKKSQEIMQFEGETEPCIKSIQIIYNMQKCREMIQKLSKISLEIVSCLETTNFRYTNNIAKQKISAYRRAKAQFIEKLTKLQTLRTQFLKNSQLRRQMATSIAILQFQCQEDQRTFLRVMGDSSNPIKTAFLPNKNGKFKDQDLKFTRSPEPSDILWINCEKKFNFIRWLMIWGVTILILYLGYTIVSYTQTWEIFKAVDHVVITIILQLLNRLIWFWLSLIINFQQNNTKTQAIISSMKKSIIAQTINIIVNPIISTFVNGKSLYGSAGLAGMGLTYQMIMVCMMLIYNPFNPFYLGKKLLLKIKCIRNIIIKYLCRIVGKIDTTQQIRPVLQFYEGPELPVAGAYVYVCSGIFHAMFYCHLQPIILVFSVINMGIFFIIMKYMLYYRCKMLQLTNPEIFRAAIFLTSCASVYYAVGSIFFFLIDETQTISLAILVPSILCILLWFFWNLNTFNISNLITDYLVNTIKQQSKVNKQLRKSCKTLNKKIHQKQIKIESVKTVKQYENKSRPYIEAPDVKSSQFFNKIPKNRQLLNSNFTQKADSIRWKRRESFYTNSTTNSLLDFEDMLKQMKDQYLAEKGSKLGKFCQQFGGILKLRKNERKNDHRKSEKLDRKFIVRQSLGEQPNKQGETLKYTFIPVIKFKKQVQNPDGTQEQYVYELNKLEFRK